MANFTTVRDLRNDALWLAGEAQTSASSYYTRSLEYLNAVLLALMSGGPLGALDLPAIDWWWAHQTRRGQLVIPNAQNVNGALENEATATLSSTTLSFASNVATSMAGYRFAFEDDRDQMLYITAHTAGTSTATTDLAWQKATKVSSRWIAWDDQIALPSDLVRLTTPLKMGRDPYEIPIVDMPSLEREFPRSRLWVGTPRLAAIVNTGTTGQLALHFSHALHDGPIVTEFEYLFSQTELVDTVGTEEPLLPHQHRRVLSLGAGYLMLFDKRDDYHKTLGVMFQGAWEAMAEEHYRHTTDNANFGRILSRQGEVASNRFPLRSPSGFIYG